MLMDGCQTNCARVRCESSDGGGPQVTHAGPSSDGDLLRQARPRCGLRTGETGLARIGPSFHVALVQIMEDRFPVDQGHEAPSTLLGTILASVGYHVEQLPCSFCKKPG